MTKPPPRRGDKARHPPPPVAKKKSWKSPFNRAAELGQDPSPGGGRRDPPSGLVGEEDARAGPSQGQAPQRHHPHSSVLAPVRPVPRLAALTGSWQGWAASCPQKPNLLWTAADFLLGLQAAKRPQKLLAGRGETSARTPPPQPITLRAPTAPAPARTVRPLADVCPSGDRLKGKSRGAGSHPGRGGCPGRGWRGRAVLHADAAHGRPASGCGEWLR